MYFWMKKLLRLFVCLTGLFFVALPVKIRGATGSMIDPIAVI